MLSNAIFGIVLDYEINGMQGEVDERDWELLSQLSV